jgi:multimeric flavodoxin WrbA
MTAAWPHFVLVNGSENNSGSTAAIVEFAAKRLIEFSVSSEIIHLADFDLLPCGPCGDCNSRVRECSVQDAMPWLVERLQSSDGLIYAAPVHAFGLSSTMQAFIERLGVGFLRFNRPLVDKIGGVISVGRRYADANVTAQLQQNMLLNRMILPGSGYPAMVRTEHGDPLQDAEGVASVTALCARVADFAHRMRPWAEGAPALATNERIF